MSEYPQLRQLNIRWSQYEGQKVLVLQDPLRLSDNSLMVPMPLAPIMGLLDGYRDLDAIRTGFLLRTGITLSPDHVESLVKTLDEALLLENQRFFDARQQALQQYRSEPYRAPALAAVGYPEGPAELQSLFDEYCQAAGPYPEPVDRNLAGLISPHIDYPRGWRTYARTWQLAADAVEQAELVILLGTDHGGAAGALTLTRQDYATPWGVLPTDTGLVDRLTEVLGEERAFAEEVHHIGEHSIELAAVWLHYMAQGNPKRLLPVLCGHFVPDPGSVPGPSLGGPNDDDTTGSEPGGVGDYPGLEDALKLLAEVASSPGVLVVAAGDVSHVGPAFGDATPLDSASKTRLSATDHEWLEAACSGGGRMLAEHMLSNGDPTRICGAAPIHHMLTILGDAKGRIVDYDQCPADEDFGSLVSIAGVVYAA